MKTRSLFLLVAMSLMMITGSVMAQYTGTNPQVTTISNALPAAMDYLGADTTSIGADSATINAEMPYFVRPDAFFKSQSAIFNPSGFAWTATGFAGITKIGGNALTDFGGGLYADTLVQVTMPAATGTQTLTVYEQSRPKAGTGCQGGTRNLSVQVVPQPTMALNAAQNDTVGGCAAVNTTLNYDFTGYYPLYVQYTVAAYNFSGTQVGATRTFYARVNSGEELQIYADQLDYASGGTGVSGEYRVVLTGVWDRLGVRALNRTNASVAYDPAASNDVHIYVYPTPTTGRINHLRTL